MRGPRPDHPTDDSHTARFSTDGVLGAGPFAAAGLGLLGLEVVARLVLDPAWPHGRDLLWDTLARAGRLGAVAGMAWLFWAALVLPARRSARLAAALAAASRVRDHLCSPLPAARMAALLALATLALTPAAARRYQLAWRAAAVYACAALACGVAVEVYLARRRSRARGWSRATWLGRTLWMAVAGFLGVLVFPRIAGFQAAVVATAALWFAVAPALRLPRWVLAGLAIAAAAGIAVEVRLPSVRRFASVHAPYSAFGLRCLRRLTDFDGDGSSGPLGLDCDNWDPARQPKAEDLPGNDVDEDCSGADARVVSAPVTAPPAPADAVLRPDVFLVTVDALRADALAWMPRTRRWANRCISFAHARSPSNFTQLAVPALLTGTEPHYLRSDYRIAIVPPLDRTQPALQSQPPTLATVLRRAGYFGSAVVPFQPPLMFLFHGFDDVRIPPERRVTTEAGEVLTQAKAALGRRPADRPLLLWTHFLDTHAPYAGGTSFADYRRAAGVLDQHLGAFLELLPHDAVVVLTADHGEAFGEHGSYTHQETLFDEELRVPLILCAPESARLGPPRSVSVLASTLDVMPTLVELVAAGRVETLGGRSLVPTLRDGAPEPHAFLRFEAWLADHHAQAVVSGCHKWMRDLDAEWEALFDLCRDPGEREDISGERPEVVRALRSLLFESADVYPAWLLLARALQQQD